MAVSNSLFLQLGAFKNVVKSGNVATNLLTRVTNRMNNVCLYSTSTAEAVKETPNVATTSTEQSPVDKTGKKMSKAMLAYLERARAHDEFIKSESEEYRVGKRHLANMMGEDPEHFTQEDVDKSIEYLFPSGLFNKAARPIMKPPEEIFPPRKAAEFDESGRPFHTMFYTTKAEFHKTLYDMVEEMENLNKFEDSMIAKSVPYDEKTKLELIDSDWLTKENYEKMILENISDHQYEYAISTLQRLYDHPYSYRCKDFIMKFRKQKKALVQSYTIPPLEYGPDGRPFVTVPDCMRKNARGSVTLRGNGTGKIIINGKSLIHYFPRMQDREQIVFPLQFVGMMEDIDVEAQVHDGGPTGQSGAIRWGISWGLRSFVSLDMVDKMRIAGLLTRDWRRRERKKPGQEGARRKFTWKKR